MKEISTPLKGNKSTTIKRANTIIPKTQKNQIFFYYLFLEKKIQIIDFYFIDTNLPANKLIINYFLSRVNFIIIKLFI